MARNGHHEPREVTTAAGAVPVVGPGLGRFALPVVERDELHKIANVFNALPTSAQPGAKAAA